MPSTNRATNHARPTAPPVAPSLSPTPRRSRRNRIALVGALATSLCVTGLVTATSASAAVPVFPDNLVVFPDRDFIAVEGYQNHVGETATVKITRAGVGVVGSASSVVAEGDVAFEINHPGGVCWGAGTGVNVTPDIQPGDVASISFAGPNGNSDGGETKVQDGYVDAGSTLAGSTVTVTGHIGPDVIKDNTEQRIVEPALTDTAVGRRDVRAVPGPMTPAPKGGYSSMLEFDDAKHTFTATYIFDDPAVAKIAADATGERLLSWELTDADANRQGITIAEFGELGGPGMGGCPNGPLQSGPPGPTDVRAANVSGGVKITWTPATALPGTPAITGYRATAVATSSSNGEQVEIGRRITGQAAKGTTITGLASGETYDFEVVSVSSVGQTFPAVPAVLEVDVTPPTVSASPNGGSFAVPQQVTLAANEPNSEIYYTTDGSDPIQVDTPSAGATLFTAPFTVDGPVTVVKSVAIDPFGNVSAVSELTFLISNTPTPATPAFGDPVVGEGQITLSWTADDPSITGYAVQVYDKDGAKRSGPKETTDKTLVVDGLSEGTPYFFTVAAKNANGYGAESAKLGPLSPLGALVAKAGPDQTGVVRNTKVSLSGAGSTAGDTYQWTQLQTGTAKPIDATDPDKVTLTGATTLDASFTLPFYKHPMSNKALTFQLTVTMGGSTRKDEVLVTPKSDTVTIGTARWKTGEFRVTGTAGTVGSVITVRSAPNAAGVSTVYGTAAVTAAAPPEVGGVWTLRIRAGATLPRTNPGTVFADSNLGGTAGPTTVANG